MELLNYWKTIRKSLWIILSLVAITLGGTAYYTLNQPPEYMSSTTLILNPSSPDSLLPYVPQAATSLAESYTRLIHTDSFAETVVEELPFAMSIVQVQKSITTRLAPNTFFYEVTVRTDNPERAQQLLVTVVEVFLAAQESQTAADSQGTDILNNTLRQRMLSKLEYLDQQIKSYQTEIQSLQLQERTDEQNALLRSLQGQLMALQQTETETVTVIAQLEGKSRSAVNRALVIDQPSPGVPVPGRLTTNLLLALSASLMLGVGIAFVRDYMDSSIDSPREVEDVMGKPPLSVISLVGNRAKGASFTKRGAWNRETTVRPPTKLVGHNLITIEDPYSLASESFRTLRTNIQFYSLEKPIRTLMVTSANPSEGKSFIAANFAIAMAQAGKRVILVDADLRKPTLHTLFELSNQAGLINVLYGQQAKLTDVIQGVDGVPNLTVITSGPALPNPAEILGSPQATMMMSKLAQQADIVIYDTPPAGVITDAIVLATGVDAVILVISAGSTRKDAVSRVQQSLQNVGAAVILPVLNRVKAADLQGYHYYDQNRGAPDSTMAGISSSGAVVSTGGNGQHPTEVNVPSVRGHQSGSSE